MIAAPSVRGLRIEGAAINFLHVAGLVGGSIGLGAALFALGAMVGHVPIWIVTGLSFALAVTSVVRPNWRLLSSRWIIPKDWAKFGLYGYPMLFGLVLGFSVLTQLPDAGIYALLAYGSSTRVWLNVWPVFIAFGLAKSVPVWLVPFALGRPFKVMETIKLASRVAEGSRPLEVGALTALGLASLFQ